jgi:DNA replicative helicase MCM subunit Mcm2 (Cdc46/Mcm family)
LHVNPRTAAGTLQPNLGTATCRTEDQPGKMSQDMLRKYITYAKQTCKPRMQSADYEKIAAVYAELRKESAISHGMPIAVRLPQY